MSNGADQLTPSGKEPESSVMRALTAFDTATAFAPGDSWIAAEAASLPFSRVAVPKLWRPSSIRATLSNVTDEPSDFAFRMIAPKSSGVFNWPSAVTGTRTRCSCVVGSVPSEPGAIWTFWSVMAAVTSLAVRPYPVSFVGSSQIRIARSAEKFCTRPTPGMRLSSSMMLRLI